MIPQWQWNPTGVFTVYVRNELLGTSHFVGTFDSEEEATKFAELKASRSRKFATFEVWKGSPRAEIEPARKNQIFRGSAG